MTFKIILEKLSRSLHLTESEAEWSMEQIFKGEASTEQVAGFLTAMTIKNETVEELTAFVRVMRKYAVKVELEVENAVDLVGTGGDKSGTFNISTAAAFAVAGAGVPIIKHNNRSASSNVGSADVMEALGAVIELDADQTKKVFEEVGMAFMFAPMFHPGMKYVMPARRQLGFRTFFNILGPMVNPAGVNRYVIGAYSEYVAQNMMQILTKLGVTRAFTFHSADGLDELSVTAPSTIFEFDGSRQKASFEFMPQDLGFERADFRDLIGGTKADNARILTDILKNESNKAQKDIVALNAAFGIYASGLTKDVKEARDRAVESIESGKAFEVMNNYLQATKDIAAS